MPSFSGLMSWIATNTSAGVNAGPVWAEPCHQTHELLAIFVDFKNCQLNILSHLALKITHIHARNHQELNAMHILKDNWKKTVGDILVDYIALGVWPINNNSFHGSYVYVQYVAVENRRSTCFCFCLMLINETISFHSVTCLLKFSIQQDSLPSMITKQIHLICWQ